MRDLLIENCSLVIWIIVAIEAILGVSLAAAYKKDKRPVIICMILVDFGLLVDALLINLGGFFDGGLPEPVSRLRFILHGMLIPLLFPICGYSLKLKRKVMSVIWALTAVVMVLGLAEGMSITLELIQLGDVVRHNSADSSPAWAETIRSFLSFGTVIPLIIVGIAVWIKQKNSYAVSLRIPYVHFRGVRSGDRQPRFVIRHHNDRRGFNDTLLYAVCKVNRKMGKVTGNN